MQLDQLIHNYPAAYIHLERYVNNKRCMIKHVEESWKYTEVNSIYTPLNGNSHVPLHVLDGTPDLIVSDPAAPLARNVTDQTPFLFHPDAGYPFATKTTVNAQPTASTRTLLLNDYHGSQLFAKVSLPKRISRYTREMTAQDVLHGIQVSTELKKLYQKTPRFGILHEFAGSTYRGIGCTFREFEASPSKPKRFLIPAFALYSRDTKKPDDELLIKQLADANGSTVQELVEWILTQTIAQWCHTASRAGLLLESHAQNTLLEVNENFEPTRIIIRDFSSTRADNLIREEVGAEGKYELYSTTPAPREQRFSLRYDFFFVRLYADTFIDACQNQYGLNISQLQEECKKAFQAHASESVQSLFDSNVFGFVERGSEKPSLELISTSPRLR